jgi:hypothetical protein
MSGLKTMLKKSRRLEKRTSAAEAMNLLRLLWHG